MTNCGSEKSETKASTGGGTVSARADGKKEWTSNSYNQATGTLDTSTGVWKDDTGNAKAEVCEASANHAVDVNDADVTGGDGAYRTWSQNANGASCIYINE